MTLQTPSSTHAGLGVGSACTAAHSALCHHRRTAGKQHGVCWMQKTQRERGWSYSQWGRWKVRCYASGEPLRLPKRVYTGKTKQRLKVGGERKEFSLWTQNTCWDREYRHCSEGNSLRFISASFLKTATCREIEIMSLIISINGKEEGCTFYWEDSVNLTF